MNFIINNQKNSQTNSCICTHNIITSNKHHLHKVNANLSCFQKRTFNIGIKVSNSLPHSQTILKNEKAKFKAALRKELNTHSFYPVDAFFMCKDDLLYFCKMLIVYYTKFVYLCIYDLSL